MTVLAEEFQTAPRLAELGMTAADLLDIVRVAVGARRNAVMFHPASAPGLFSWLEGTGQMRRVFLAKESWELSRRDNIESVYNPQLGIKIIFQNAERAGDPIFEPLAANRKGAASARAVDLGQIEMFPEHRIEKERTAAELNATVWILFVEAEGQRVRAEFSCPKAISDEQYAGFHERILLVQDGEWDKPDPQSVDGEPPADYEVTVTRKG
ncbi:hypothetical protein GCM10023208_18810 [Erythrobacter westpacificensis]|uniref:Uncharacterized protein n=1 Tax=Erythrobacter westpacificensis TaxID=1055231 RepID=A0ABP9KBY0_9SPHN